VKYYRVYADTMSGHKIAVLGIGNPLCRDDGVGIRVVQLMQSSGKYPDIDIIDGGTAPDLFLLLDESVERLIIVDALRAAGTCGQLYRLEINESNIAEGPQASPHGPGVLDSLQMMVRLGIKPPQVTLIGVEPFDVTHGFNLSPQMEGLVAGIIAAVEEEIGKTY
jgi:hydrogenase maturation protease